MALQFHFFFRINPLPLYFSHPLFFTTSSFVCLGLLQKFFSNVMMLLTNGPCFLISFSPS